MGVKETIIVYWSDIDIGNLADDLAGCDTLLDMGYVYNGRSHDQDFMEYSLPPACAGYSIVQGPRVPATGEMAYFDSKTIDGWQNLPMTSFFCAGVGDPIPSPVSTEDWYKSLRGFMPVGGTLRYLPFPPNITPGPYPFSGDPVSGEGFIDGRPEDGPYSWYPRDVRSLVNSGPFTLAPGDTQEVVLVFTVGLGADRLSSISVAKHLARQLKLWYPHRPEFKETETTGPALPSAATYFSLSQNFPNPFSDKTDIQYAVAGPAIIKISVFDLLGREIAVLEKGLMESGDHSTSWNGRDNSGKAVPSGVYFVKPVSENFPAPEQILLVQKVFLVR